MNEERMAKAWELAAEICGRFDCDELNPPRSDEEFAGLDEIIGEMHQQAKRLRAEGALLEGVHGNLISPNSVLDRSQPPAVTERQDQGHDAGSQAPSEAR